MWSLAAADTAEPRRRTQDATIRVLSDTGARLAWIAVRQNQHLGWDSPRCPVSPGATFRIDAPVGSANGERVAGAPCGCGQDPFARHVVAASRVTRGQSKNKSGVLSGCCKNPSARRDAGVTRCIHRLSQPRTAAIATTVTTSHRRPDVMANVTAMKRSAATQRRRRPPTRMPCPPGWDRRSRRSCLPWSSPDGQSRRAGGGGPTDQGHGYGGAGGCP